MLPPLGSHKLLLSTCFWRLTVAACERSFYSYNLLKWYFSSSRPLNCGHNWLLPPYAPQCFFQTQPHYVWWCLPCTQMSVFLAPWGHPVEEKTLASWEFLVQEGHTCIHTTHTQKNSSGISTENLVEYQQVNYENVCILYISGFLLLIRAIFK